MPIKVLPPEVTSKIAAGEVIERPASVVKELLENSLDAGASEITVEAQNGGVSFIRVTDNGCGLAPDEAELAFKRHATSKINGLDDLEHIHTLGFRGEALPSIASVAEVEMLTREEAAPAAVYLRLDNGEIAAREKRNRPPGTTITVRRLFHSFPARLKFLKAPSSEAGHIATTVSQYSLSFPDVKFTLIIDGRVNLRTGGDGDLRSAIAEIYGLDTAQKMITVDGSDVLMKIDGLCSQPSVQRSNRNYSSFFVNKRYVRNSLLAKAVESAYGELLMTGRHPVVVLNVSIPPEEVDVNVHPTKLEVKFRNNSMVFSAIQRAVNNALIKSPLPDISFGPDDARPASLWERLPASGFPALRTLGQLSGSYILAEGDEGLYLIDQHAAHERILFEKIFKQRKEQKLEIQGMLEPLPVELTPAQNELLHRSSGILAEFGFSVEPFGERTWLLRAVPAMLNNADLPETVRELLDTAGNERDMQKKEGLIAQSLACHGAIRAGDILDADEMRRLISQLENTSQPRTCPHGRPTMIHLSSQQLKKEFGRTG